MSDHGAYHGWEDSGNDYEGDYGSVYGSDGEWVEREVSGDEHQGGYGSDDGSSDGQWLQGELVEGHASGGYGGRTQFQNPSTTSSYGYSKNSNSQQSTYMSNTYNKQSHTPEPRSRRACPLVMFSRRGPPEGRPTRMSSKAHLLERLVTRAATLNII